jgi:hypothetical protein
LAIIWDSRTLTEEPKTQSPEDQKARQLFKEVEDYYETEVQTFFPEDDDGEARNSSPFLSGEHNMFLFGALPSWEFWGAIFTHPSGIFYPLVQIIRRGVGMLRVHQEMYRRSLSTAA